MEVRFRYTHNQLFIQGQTTNGSKQAHLQCLGGHTCHASDLVWLRFKGTVHGQKSHTFKVNTAGAQGSWGSRSHIATALDITQFSSGAGCLTPQSLWKASMGNETCLLASPRPGSGGQAENSLAHPHNRHCFDPRPPSLKTIH